MRSLLSVPETRLAPMSKAWSSTRILLPSIADVDAAIVTGKKLIRADALIGNDLLRHFRVTFDYSRRRLILEKR